MVERSYDDGVIDEVASWNRVTMTQFGGRAVLCALARAPASSRASKVKAIDCDTATHAAAVDLETHHQQLPLTTMNAAAKEPRKRSLEESDTTESSKRPHRRGRQEEEAAAAASEQDDDDGESNASSVQASLAVPLDFIFRQVVVNPPHDNKLPQRQQKPLLSRAEAQCFLSIRLLASEVDSLVAATGAALKKRHAYGQFADRVARRQSTTLSPFLRPLLPLLSTLGDFIPGRTLEMIQAEMDTVLQELQAAAVSLRQSSEQNWTLSESLMDTIGSSGEGVARDKRRLSDIQDEVRSRIEKLLATEEDEGGVTSAEPLVTMKDYCKRVWSRDHSHLLHSPSASQQSQSQQSQSSRKSAKNDAEGSSSQSPTAMADEKENAPSQKQSTSSSSSQQSPCAVGGMTQNAAEVLSALATTTWHDASTSADGASPNE